MKATIIIIGDEVLLGRVTDTNSGAISRALEPCGIGVVEVLTVHDDADDIRRAVKRAMACSDVVVTTGGLGPTKDDITKKVLCELFGGKMVRDDSVTENIKRVFREKNLQLNALTLDQALVPDCCRVIQNVYGTAPVMWFEKDGHVLVSMPGVPAETEGMLVHPQGVIAAIRQHFAADMHFAHRTAIVTGISESALAQLLEAFELELPAEAHLAYLPYSPIIKLRIDVRGTDTRSVEDTADRCFDKLCGIVSDLLVARNDLSVAEILLDRLKTKGMSVGTAESCTGGKIASALTAVPGASESVMGGIVSYSNDVKHRVLGVPQQVLDTEGAVSRPTVEAMLVGACRVLGTDCAMATSGVAGPGGGTPEKPVGTVWVGARAGGVSDVRLYHFRGTRDAITNRAVTMAMLNLISLLCK